MKSHRRIWVESALDNTDAENAVELRAMIRNGEIGLKGANMVTREEGIEFCEKYMADEERRCLDCEIECMAGDRFYICPNCNRKYS